MKSRCNEKLQNNCVKNDTGRQSEKEKEKLMNERQVNWTNGQRTV